MKRFILLLIASFWIVACQNDIPFEMPDKDNLIVNACFYTNDDIHSVRVSVADDKRVAPLSQEASVKMFIGEDLVAQSDSVVKDVTSETYYLRAQIKPEDRVKITVYSGDFHAEATAEAPKAPKFSIDTVHVSKYKHIYLIEPTIVVKSQEKNSFYITTKGGLRLVFRNNETGEEYEKSDRESVWINTKDPIFKNQTMAFSSTLSSDLGLALTGLNYWLVFSDELFDNNQYRFRCKNINGRDFEKGEWAATMKKGFEVDRGYVVMTLGSLTESFFRYCRAVDDYFAVSGDPFREPLIVPSNVKGGLGYFGIVSVSEESFEFPDVAEATSWTYKNRY